MVWGAGLDAEVHVDSETQIWCFVMIRQQYVSVSVDRWLSNTICRTNATKMQVALTRCS